MKKHIFWMAVFLLIGALAVAQTGAGSSASGTQSPNQQITNGPVAEYVADSNATIGWSAREGSGSMSIKYGSDRDHLNQTAEAVPGSDGRNYHARLQGLMPETRYYFQVMQKDEAVGGVGTFRTVASGTPAIKSKAVIPQ
ncbi:MAG TPA: fibronectin type III domain-containing protein [Candidatus Angelobacter sp.]